MRKSTVVTAVILVVLSFGAWLFLANPLSRDAGLVRAAALAFMEDLQFKDFRSSSLYHHELERDRVDVGRTLEKLFLVKPELLNILEFKIVKLDIDKSGDRARVLLRTKYKRLNYDEKPQDGEAILYWIKRHPQCPLGATCSAEKKCMDEFDKVLYRPEEKNDKEREREREKETRPKPPEGDAANPAMTKEHFVCDPEAKFQWYMNLDSTLKEKRYNY